MIKQFGILGILVIYLLVNTASAGFSLKIDPVGSESTVPGGTIEYIVTLTIDSNGLESDWEDVHLKIDDKRTDWNYVFNPENFRIFKTDNSKSSTLTINVPNDAEPGIYSHAVSASGYDEFGQNLCREYPEACMPTDVQIEIFEVPVDPVSELSPGILTSIGIFGIFIVSRKYRKK